MPNSHITEKSVWNLQRRTKWNKQTFLEVRQSCKQIIRLPKRQRTNRYEDKITKCSVGDKSFWRSTKEIQKGNGRSPIPSLIHGDHVLSDTRHKAHLFCSIFGNISNDNQCTETPAFSEKTTNMLPHSYPSEVWGQHCKLSILPKQQHLMKVLSVPCGSVPVFWQPLYENGLIFSFL